MSTKEILNGANSPRSVDMSPKCLGMVLTRTDHDVRKNDTNTKGTGHGEHIFLEFVRENQLCYWNPVLEESVKNIHYAGFLIPNTLLLNGKDVYLDNMRHAWSRKLLKPPKGYTIAQFGEVGCIEFEPIPQTQFTPLPEALCLAVSELNRQETAATLSTLRDRLLASYEGNQVPPDQIIYETLGGLIKERKLYHTGNGYFVVTPDTYKIPLSLSLPDHALLINSPDGYSLTAMQSMTPMLVQLRPTEKHLRSTSCQTADEKVGHKPKKRLHRSQSVRDHHLKDIASKDEPLSRSLSLRYNEVKADGIVKDINLNTSNINKDKDKGTKVSLFDRLLRKSSKKAKPKSKEARKDVEYVTFSAQFPPSEWYWYRDHLDAHRTQAMSDPTCAPNVAKQEQPTPDWDPPQRAPTPAQNSVQPCNVGTKNHGPKAKVPQYQRSKSHPMAKSKTWHHLQGALHNIPECEEHSGRKNCPTSEELAQTELYSEDPRQHRGDGTNVIADHRRGHLQRVDHRSGQRVDHGDTKHKGLSGTLGSFHIDDNPVDVLSPNMDNEPREPQGSRNQQKQMYYTSFCGDITVEYQGRLRNKDSKFATSCDSGVNCLGLTPPVEGVPLSGPTDKSVTKSQIDIERDLHPSTAQKILVHKKLSSKVYSKHEKTVPSLNCGNNLDANLADSGFNSPHMSDNRFEESNESNCTVSGNNSCDSPISTGLHRIPFGESCDTVVPNDCSIRPDTVYPDSHRGGNKSTDVPANTHERSPYRLSFDEVSGNGGSPYQPAYQSDLRTESRDTGRESLYQQHRRFVPEQLQRSTTVKETNVDGDLQYDSEWSMDKNIDFLEDLELVGVV